MEHPRNFRGHWTTVVSDALDQQKFRAYLEASSKLQALEEKGAEKLPTFEGLMFDLDSSFLYPTPVMRPAGAVLPSHRLNAAIVRQLHELPEYKEIHLTTEMDDLLSAMAVIEVGEAVMSIITKKEEEQIRNMQEQEKEMNELQQKADGAGQNAREAERDAQGARAKANASGNPQDQSVAEQAGEQAQATAQTARQTLHSLEEAREMLDGMASDLLQEFNAPERKAQMRQAIRQAVGELAEKVSEEKDLLELWGFDAGEVKEMDYQTIESLAQKLKANERLLKIAEMLGALKPFWQGRLREKEQVGVEITDENYFGNDLLNIHAAELVELADPDLEDFFHLKYAEESLFCTRTKVKVKMGEGPVMIKRDRSGSMEGEKEIGATALELAITNMVTRDKRATAHIWFTATAEPLEVVECLPRGSGMQAKRYLVEWHRDGSQKIISGSEKTMSYFEAYVHIATQGRSRGGTEFDSPIRWALELLGKEEFARADAVLITDGHADLPDETIRRVNHLREEKNVFFLSVLINTGSASAASVKRFSDVKLVSELNAEAAGEIISSF